MSADLLTKLIAAGTPAELVGEVAMALARAEASAQALERRRRSDRERQRDRRGASRDITLDGVTARDKADTKEIPPNPHKKIYSPIEASASIAPKGQTQRASRIPADWAPPPIASLPPKARALAEQWPDGAYEAEAEAHHNFWLSEGGARARKVDWTRAWCNRIVQISAAVLRSAKAGVRYPAAPKPAASTDWMTRAKTAEIRAGVYEMQGRTHEAAEQRAAAQRFVQMAASPGLAAQPPPLSIGGTIQ